MKISKFFTLGSVSKLAKLVGKSISTIYRWRRNGIPQGSQEQVKKLVSKSKKKPKKSEIVPLTAREKKQRKQQKDLALAEQHRLKHIGDEWTYVRLPQRYTEKRVVALFNAVERNRENLVTVKDKKRKRRIKLAIKIGLRMIRDYGDGALETDPDLVQELIDEYNVEEHEAWRDIYGYLE